MRLREARGKEGNLRVTQGQERLVAWDLAREVRILSLVNLEKHGNNQLGRPMVKGKVELMEVHVYHAVILTVMEGVLTVPEVLIFQEGANFRVCLEGVVSPVVPVGSGMVVHLVVAVFLVMAIMVGACLEEVFLVVVFLAAVFQEECRVEVFLGVRLAVDFQVEGFREVERQEEVDFLVDLLEEVILAALVVVLQPFHLDRCRRGLVVSWLSKSQFGQLTYPCYQSCRSRRWGLW